MNTMANKTALVTGGGSGIGASIALAFAEQGARVVICGRRPDPLKAVATQIKNGGGIAAWVEADVSQPDDVQRVVAATLDQGDGRIDVLVNNAGISAGGYLHNHAIDVWDQVMAINLRGPFLMSRAVLPIMRRQASGHIIHISSEAGLEHIAGSGAYGVAKHGLNAMAEIMQKENQSLGIRVDTICPGMVVTEMTENADGLDFDRCLQPDDIADLAVWLVSRRSNIKIGTPVLIQTMLNPWEKA